MLSDAFYILFIISLLIFPYFLFAWFCYKFLKNEKTADIFLHILYFLYLFILIFIQKYNEHVYFEKNCYPRTQMETVSDFKERCSSYKDDDDFLFKRGFSFQEIFVFNTNNILFSHSLERQIDIDIVRTLLKAKIFLEVSRICHPRHLNFFEDTLGSLHIRLEQAKSEDMLKIYDDWQKSLSSICPQNLAEEIDFLKKEGYDLQAVEQFFLSFSKDNILN